MPSAIVLAIDGLGAGHLGPYGNTWLDTPAFNQLATESALAEQMYAPTASTLDNYSSLWQGTDALGRPRLTAAKCDSLIGSLHEQGISTRLFTDDPDLLDHRLAAAFAEQSELRVVPVEGCAEEWEHTHTARFFAEGVGHIEALDEQSLLWIHTRGLGNPWDAPLSFRERFADEADPEVFAATSPPHCVLAENFDPDILHAIRCAFAGQITLIDHCLEVVRGLLDALPTRDPMLFVVVGTRGYPLGEHRQVGWSSSLALHRELLHVPWLVRFPDRRLAMHRIEGLGEFPDITALLDGWFRDPASATITAADRDYSLSQRDTERLLRTRCWTCRFPQITDRMEHDLGGAELYVKPDDLTEVNDVSDRCAEVTEAAWRFTTSCLNTSDDVCELPDVLKEPSG